MRMHVKPDHKIVAAYGKDSITALCAEAGVPTMTLSTDWIVIGYTEADDSESWDTADMVHTAHEVLVVSFLKSGVSWDIMTQQEYADDYLPL